MKIVNIIRGHRGKTLFSRVLHDYYKFHLKKPLIIYDGDRVSKNLQSCCEKAINNYVFDNIVQKENIINSLNKNLFVSSDILINISGNYDINWGIDYYLKIFFEDSFYLKLNNTKIIHWFLSDGSQSSYEYLDSIFGFFSENYSVVLIKNVNRDSDSWNKEQFLELFQKHSIENFRIIELFWFNPEIDSLIRSLSMNFTSFSLECYEKKKLVALGAVNNFLEKIYLTLNEIVELLPEDKGSTISEFESEFEF